MVALFFDFPLLFIAAAAESAAAAVGKALEEHFHRSN